MKKGTDTSRRNTVSEFYNASIRYFSTKSQFPWTGGQPSGEQMGDSTMMGVITTLQTAGELKSDFANLAGGTTALNFMYVTSTTSQGSESVTVCFLPQSKSFQFDKVAKYDTMGNATDTNCKSIVGAGGNNCYWCIK